MVTGGIHAPGDGCGRGHQAGPGARAAATCGLTLCSGGFARLEDLAEAAEVGADLAAGALAQQLGQASADAPRGRQVVEYDVDLGAAPAGGLAEDDGAGVV